MIVRCGGNVFFDLSCDKFLALDLFAIGAPNRFLLLHGSGGGSEKRR